MNELLAELIPQVQPLFLTVILASARVVGLFIMVPIFPTNMLPGLMRTVFLVVLSALAVPPLFAELQAAAPYTPVVIILVLKEVVLGALMGYLSAVAFWSIESVGLFIDNQRGATAANSIDPLSGSQASPMGSIMLRIFITYFLSAGGMTVLLGTLYITYDLWPILSFYPQVNDLWTPTFLSQLDSIMRLVIVIGAPVIIVMLLTDLSFSLVSRFVPQLNVFFISFTVKSGVAMLVLLLYVERLLDYNYRLSTRIADIPQVLHMAITPLLPP